MTTDHLNSSVEGELIPFAYDIVDQVFKMVPVNDAIKEDLIVDLVWKPAFP